MQPKSSTPFRRSAALSLPFLLVAAKLQAQKPSGTTSLRDAMAYEPWQHGVLATLLMSTVALAVVFALHNRKSRKLIDMHRSLKNKVQRVPPPSKKSTKTIDFGKPPTSSTRKEAQ